MRAVSTAASVVRHSLGAVGEALLIAAIIAALLLALAPVYKPADFLAGTGLAAAGKVKYSVEVDNGVFGSTTVAEVYGDRTDYVVKARCFQNGTLVYFEVVEADYHGYATLTLGPTERWTSGAASCTAEGGYYTSNLRWKKVASAAFSVAAE